MTGDESKDQYDRRGRLQYLFGAGRDGKTLAKYSEGRTTGLEEEIRRWDPGELLAMPDQEIVDYLVSTYALSCPVLRRGEGWSTGPEPVDLPVHSPIPGTSYGSRDRPLYTIPATRRTFVIPYAGDEEIFYRRPNPFSISQQPEAEIRAAEVHITWQRPEQDAPDPEQINSYVTEQLDRLQFYLDQSARHIEMFNRELAAQAARLITERKERHKRERDVSASWSIRCGAGQMLSSSKPPWPGASWPRGPGHRELRNVLGTT